MFKQMMRVIAEMEERDLCTRYTFELYGKDGDSSRKFIIDVPDNDEYGGTDVWVLNSLVGMGGTAEDGFATFVPWKERS